MNRGKLFVWNYTGGFAGLSLLLSCFAWLPCPASGDTSQIPSLKETYSGNFLIGTAIGMHFDGNRQIQDLVCRQFDVLTSENCMKPKLIHPEEDKYDFTDADKLVEFAMANKMKVVGHTFVWHNTTPDWFFIGPDGKQASRELVLKRMKDHITTVMTRYKGKVLGWDVVNEAIGFGSNELLKTTSPWYKCVGPDFVEKAFEYAHDADPDAELYYNDYSIEQSPRREKTVALIKSLKDKGLRIDAVGIQGHWGLKKTPLKNIEAAIVAFSECGVKVMITELDIDVLPGKPEGADITEKAEWKKELDPYRDGCPANVMDKQAEVYAALFKLLLKYQGTITRVTFWGFTDSYSFLNNWPIKGRTNYGLLFDRELKPKPAFFSVIRAANDTNRVRPEGK